MNLLPKVFRTEGDMVDFDPSKILASLIKETNLNEQDAKHITELAVRRIISSDIKFLSGPHIREIVCSILSEQHFESERKFYTRIGMPLMDYEEILEKISIEKSGKIINPEKIHHRAANKMSQEYALLRILNDDESKAHLYGDIHIHKLRYFDLRPLNQFWDPRIILKNGLPPIKHSSICSKSGPANSLKVAAHHLAKWLGMTQGEFSGEQGYKFLTAYLSPYAKNLNDNDIKLAMKDFVYEISQLSAIIGWKNPASSIFCCPRTIGIISSLPAIGPNGKTIGTYGDYNTECLKIFNALVDVFKEGDYFGNTFIFPKQFVYFKEEWLKKYESAYFNVWQEILKGRELYLINLCSAWMKNKINEENRNNGYLSSGILQAICLNLPRYAYLSKNEINFLEIIEEKMNLCFRILSKKYDLIEKRLKSKHLPLCSGIVEGQPLFKLENQKLAISIIGLNEAVKFLTNYDLHENINFGQKIIKTMNEICVKMSEKNNKNYILLENPSETANLRFAKLNLIHFPDSAKSQLTDENAVYTNSGHFRETINLSLLERINKQSEFHALIQNNVIEEIVLKEKDKDFEFFNKLLLDICVISKIGCLKFNS